MPLVSGKISWNYKGRQGGQELFTERVNIIAAFLGRPREFYEEMTKLVLPTETAAQFASQGGYLGTPWEPLAPQTVRRRGSATPILDDTGRLRESFQEGGADHIELVTDEYAEWGSSRKGALAHQTGTGGGFGNPGYQAPAPPRSHRRGASTGHRGMPQRQIIFWSARMQEVAREKLKARLAQKIREAGFGQGSNVGNI